jgi:hypothetical protein
MARRFNWYVSYTVLAISLLSHATPSVAQGFCQWGYHPASCVNSCYCVGWCGCTTIYDMTDCSGGDICQVWNVVVKDGGSGEPGAPCPYECCDIVGWWCHA